VEPLYSGGAFGIKSPFFVSFGACPDFISGAKQRKKREVGRSQMINDLAGEWNHTAM
jgi:hypothetical protein